MNGMYEPGLVVHSGGMPTLVTWVGTDQEYEVAGHRVSDYLRAEGYATTSWCDGPHSVMAVHLINRAGFETQQEQQAVCTYIMGEVNKVLSSKAAAPSSVKTSIDIRPVELTQFQQGDGWAKYTVLVACGSQVAEADFVQNEHGWFCDRIGWEFRWDYPIPDGGPQRDGAQSPSRSPREAALTLLTQEGCGNLYFKILLDEFPPGV